MSEKRRELTSEEKKIMLRQEKIIEKEQKYIEYEIQQEQLYLDSLDLILYKQKQDKKIEVKSFKKLQADEQDETIKEYFAYKIKEAELLIKKGFDARITNMKVESEKSIIGMNQDLKQTRFVMKTVKSQLKCGVVIKNKEGEKQWVKYQDL